MTFIENREMEDDVDEIMPSYPTVASPSPPPLVQPPPLVPYSDTDNTNDDMDNTNDVDTTNNTYDTYYMDTDDDDTLTSFDPDGTLSPPPALSDDMDPVLRRHIDALVDCQQSFLCGLKQELEAINQAECEATQGHSSGPDREILAQTRL